MELQKRKSNRLKDYDYSQNGAYFITICSKDKRCMFSDIPVGADTIRPQNHVQLDNAICPKLTTIGEIIKNSIDKISEIYPCINVDYSVIMPNHIHLLIAIEKTQSTCTHSGRILSAPTISKIVAYFKQNASRNAGMPIWQKSFHDHVVRDSEDYDNIANYIINNPTKWTDDCFYVGADNTHPQ